MLLAKIVESGFRSVAIIGLGKNTGKTFTLNQLLAEGERLGVTTAVTSIGLDGEEQDSLFGHDKPRVLVRPGQIIATARELLLAGGLDYEILSLTGITTRLGEIVLARAKSSGRVMLAGPGTRSELVSLQEVLQRITHDLLLVDGAVDRRSLAAPTVTHTTIFAVGAEAAWERFRLLEKLQLQWGFLTLPGLGDLGLVQHLQSISADAKMIFLAGRTVRRFVAHDEAVVLGEILAKYVGRGVETVFIRGMLTDELLDAVLGAGSAPAALTLLVPDATHVFLSGGGFQRLLSSGANLKVLNPIHISAVTVNPFNSRHGYAEPIKLLEDVGRVVEPVPCFDLFLGIRYEPRGDGDAVFGCGYGAPLGV